MRLFNELLTVENVGEASKESGRAWTDYVNPDSLIMKEEARVWDFMADAKEYDRFQFERIGYFCIDKTSKTDAVGGRLVFNKIVALKEAAAKKAGADK